MNDTTRQPYRVTDVHDDKIIEEALGIIAKRFVRGDDALDAPRKTMDYCKVLLGGYEHEVFAMLSLDNRNRVIAWHELFRGTIDGASVYPREVVKVALADNAAAVILCHNHPSGNPEPSQADIRITERITQALGLIDVRVLDHIIVAGDKSLALAERGLV